jgi:hypothetical protein
VSEYFIRLSTLLGTDFPEKLPVLGYLAKNIGVRQWRETWNDDATVTSAEAVLDGELFLEVGGFRFSIGNPSGGQTAFRLEIASARNSILTSFADRAEETAGITDPPPRDGLQIFARSDGPPSASRIQLHDIDFRIRLPESWAKKGKIVGDRIVPDGDQPVEISVLGGTLVIEPDATEQFHFVQNNGEAITVDPIWIEKLNIGIEIDNLKLDLDDTAGIPEVLARPGYQESWTGLYLEKFRIYGMQALFPTLPNKVDSHNPPAGTSIEVSKVLIGFNDGGVTGLLKVQGNVGTDENAVLRGAGFEIEIERGNLIRFEHQFTLRLGKTGGDEFSQQVNRDLQFIASFRWNPDGRFGWELALKTDPGMADGGLFTLGPDATLAIQGAIAFWVLMDEINDAQYTDAIMLAGLLALLSNLQLKEMLVFKGITLDALRIRYREELVAGRYLKYIEVFLDINLRLALDLKLREIFPFGQYLLPNIQTDPNHPLGVLMKGLRISYAYNIDDFTEAELDGRSELSFGWPEDYFFDFSNQTLLKGSPIVLTKFGFGRWDRGMWMDLGLRVADNVSSGAYSVMPSVVRLYFLTNGEIDHVTFEGLSFSIMVPGVLFIRGRLNLGDTVTEASLQGYFLASSPGLSLKEYEDRKNWRVELGAQYRKEDLPDGSEATIIFAFIKTSTGLPLFANMALYGLHFLYADKMRPALGGDPIDKWYTDHDPKNQIEIGKWEADPAAGLGIGAGLVIGSQADRGRPWNLQVGLLYIDSQWLLHGYLNIFQKHPEPENTSRGALTFLGAWGPGRLLGAVRWVQEMPADGKVLKLDLGAELLMDDSEDQSHFYAGFHWPPEKHLKAILFERYEVSFYLMLDSADVENFAGLGQTLPGFVAALGVRFAIEGGRKKGRLKLYFYLRAIADLAFAGSRPLFTVIHAAVAGGLVAKAYGIGFELEAAAEFTWIRPQPYLLNGQIRITLDLPWPIPNLRYTLDVSDGNDAPTEALQEMIEGLTLITRLPSGATELSADVNTERVPLDPTFTLAFSYPTRNGASVDGNFQIVALGLNAVDSTVTHETSGGHGYAVELTALRLWRGVPGSGTLHPGPIPAKWVNQQTSAPGGQPSRRILELFSIEDVALARLIGPSAQFVTGLADGWSPCEPAEPPHQACYLWTDEPLGPIAGTKFVELDSLPPLHVTVLSEPDGAESSRRFFGWMADLAEVVQLNEVVPFDPLPDFSRALKLPAAKGVTMPDNRAAPSLELRFKIAHLLSLDIIRPSRGARVTVRFYLGDKLIKEEVDGVFVRELPNRLELRNYSSEGPLDHAVIEASFERDPTGAHLDPSAFLLRACVVFESDYRRFQDALESAGIWDDFWITAHPADPLVLQPATHYSLEIEGTWSRVKDGTETPGGPFRTTFEFDTVNPDQWPQRLRGIDQSVDGKANYDIKTVPASGAVAVYANRSMRLEFRNRRIEAMYGAFGRRLAIRLVDDQGTLITRWLEYNPEPASDLPASELAWLDVVRSAACTPDGVEGFWFLPVVQLTSVLAPARRYDASIYALDGSPPDFNAVDWKNQPTLYQFTFRTSRWPTFAEHFAAYTSTGALDELVNNTVSFPELAAAVESASRIADDILLVTLMNTLLRLPMREPPAEPELVRVWQSTETGDKLVALLLDGPEPFPRLGDGSLELRTPSDVVIPIVIVQGASGTRTLILFRDGASGLTAISPVQLRIVVADHWIGADGSDQTDNAVLDLPVPARPPFLEQEGPP